MGNSNREIKYECSGPDHEGDRQVIRDNLRVKRIQFMKLGRNGRVIQSRNVAFLCLRCVDKDPDYTRPPLVAAPGMADTRLAHEGAAASGLRRIGHLSECLKNYLPDALCTCDDVSPEADSG